MFYNAFTLKCVSIKTGIEHSMESAIRQQQIT